MLIYNDDDVKDIKSFILIFGMNSFDMTKIIDFFIDFISDNLPLAGYMNISNTIVRSKSLDKYLLTSPNPIYQIGDVFIQIIKADHFWNVGSRFKQAEIFNTRLFDWLKNQKLSIQIVNYFHPEEKENDYVKNIYMSHATDQKDRKSDKMVSGLAAGLFLLLDSIKKDVSMYTYCVNITEPNYDVCEKIVIDMVDTLDRGIKNAGSKEKIPDGFLSYYKKSLKEYLEKEQKQNDKFSEFTGEDPDYS